MLSGHYQKHAGIQQASKDDVLNYILMDTWRQILCVSINAYLPPGAHQVILSTENATMKFCLWTVENFHLV